MKFKVFARIAFLFVAAFVLTNIINSALTLSYQAIARLPSADEIGKSWLYDPAYQATVPWHALVAFLTFSIVALWLNKLTRSTSSALCVGLVWAATAISIDAIVYVAILGTTRWGLPASEFYLGNQPWITLTYLGVMLSPLVARTVGLRRAPSQAA